MTRPVYKIEVYDSTPTLIHTITADVPVVRAKETLTSNIGTFAFTVPAKKGGNYSYDDIVLNDSVKIWFGEKTLPTNPFTVGKIYQIRGVMSKQLGYQTTFRGRNQGEILQRRLKSMKTWTAIDASVIVTELANDLGLGVGEIEADTTDVTMTIDVDRYETYFNVLRALSDYWYDAGTQIKKDFYVDIDDNLVWKSRPIRTSGVETFTIGTNISTYSVLRDKESVRNKIYVYGAPELANPSDHDTLTEDVTLVGNTLVHADGTWSVGHAGETISKDADEATGSWCCKTSGGAGTELDLTLDADTYINANHYPSITAQVKAAAGFDHLALILEDSVGSSVERTTRLSDGEYTLVTFPAGRKHSNQWSHNVFNATAFDWENVKIIKFDLTDSAGDSLQVDNLFFNSRNYSSGTVEDAVSQASYDIGEMTVIDEALRSNSDCEKRAEALLYQLKDAPVRLDMVVKGNSNLFIGDRLSITIPAEGLSAASFDVVTVEHAIVGDADYTSHLVAVDTGNLRSPPASTTREVLVREFRTQRQIGKGVLMVK